MIKPVLKIFSHKQHFFFQLCVSIVRLQGGQSDNCSRYVSLREKGFRVDLFTSFIHVVSLIYRKSRRWECWVIWLPVSVPTVNIISKCWVFTHLHDPLRVLQALQEGVLRVRWGSTGGAGSQQLFKCSFHLPCVRKIHRHQLTVQRRVQPEALQ